MTKQEIFDKVATALIKQGAPCLDTNGLCSYYNHGNRCAIGWLVDEETAKSFEDTCGGSGVEIINTKFDIGFISDNLDFLTLLQDAHDEPSEKSVEEWLQDFKSQMEAIAKDFNLDSSALYK
jgi:hypothetical protein